MTLEHSGAPWMEAEVADHDGAEVLLRPHSADASTPAGVAPGVPVEATMSWTTDRGVFEVSVSVTAEAGDGEPAWRAVPVGTTRRLQRRAHVRLPMGGPMTLSHEHGSRRGVLVDLSEAALRARFTADRGAPLKAGDPVRAVFTLHRTSFMLRGTVLREQPTDEPGTIDVVVMLDIPARTANDLRRGVVFEQIGRLDERPTYGGAPGPDPDGTPDPPRLVP